jgi:phage tail sheath protein FI
LKLNVRKFWMLFVLFNLVFLLSGCTASWIGAIEALLPAVSAAVSAILSFVLSLEGKTVPASVTAAIQKIVGDVQTQLQNLSSLIATAQTGGATVISQIGAVLNGVLSNLGSILSGLSISDSSTIQKITELVGLAVSAVQAILAIVPLASAKLQAGMTTSEAEAFDKATATNVKHIHKGLQEGYKVVRTTETVNAEVNTALLAMPESLP